MDLSQLDDLSDATLEEGVVIPLDDDRLSVFVHKGPEVCFALLLDRNNIIGDQLVSTDHNLLRGYFRSKIRNMGILASCGDGVIPVKSLKHIPHRDLQVISSLRGQGVGNFLLSVTDKVGGVLKQEVGFRPDRHILLLKRGYIPVCLHFFNVNDQVSEKLPLGPAEAQKIADVIRIFSIRNWRPERLPFAIEFIHETANLNGVYAKNFRQSRGLSTSEAQDLTTFIFDRADEIECTGKKEGSRRFMIEIMSRIAENGPEDYMSSLGSD